MKKIFKETIFVLIGLFYLGFLSINFISSYQGLIRSSSSVANAEINTDKKNCLNVDVSGPLGNVRNQGNIGWCYANVAADLLTFRFQKQLQGKRASAAFVALIFNENTLKMPNQDSGLIIPATLFSQWHGICPMGVEEKALQLSPFKNLRTVINNLTSLKASYDASRSSEAYQNYLFLMKEYRNSQSILNQITDKTLFEILDSSTVFTFPKNIAAHICGPQMIKLPIDIKLRYQHHIVNGLLHFPILPSLEIIQANGRESLIKNIHRQLDKGNMVAIGYKTSIFYLKGSDRYNRAGLHASSIVGRSWNEGNKTCEFKLRNSYGIDCSQYTNLELKGKCDPKTGYLYIDEKILSRTVDEIIYFAK
jgi:hypothetical protein